MTAQNLHFSDPQRTAPGHNSVFLVDQLSKELKSPRTTAHASAAKALTLVARHYLDSVWSTASHHLATLENDHYPHVEAVIEKWNALGLIVGVSAIAIPLSGCGWYMCPLYQEKAAKKMARCKGCHRIQYCNKKCQAR